MNKEQIKHLMDMLKELATGQFIFLGGKNFYLYALSNDIDLFVLGLSALIYMILHVIIHLTLSLTGD